MVTNISQGLCCQVGGVAQFPGHQPLGPDRPLRGPLSKGPSAAPWEDAFLHRDRTRGGVRGAASPNDGPASHGRKKARLGRGGAWGDCSGPRPPAPPAGDRAHFLSYASGYFKVCETGPGLTLDFKQGIPK